MEQLARRPVAVLVLSCALSAQFTPEHHVYTPVGRRLERIGSRVAGVGGLDRDGCPDLLVAYRDGVPVYTGRSGRRVRGLSGKKPGESFAAAMRGVGDVDKDGYPDFLIGASGAACKPFSLKTKLAYLATAVPAGELDHDGVVDVAVKDPSYNWSRGVVELLSGKTWKIIGTLKGGGIEPSFGAKRGRSETSADTRRGAAT